MPPGKIYAPRYASRVYPEDAGKLYVTINGRANVPQGTVAGKGDSATQNDTL